MRIPKTIVQKILYKHLQKWKLYVQFVAHALTAEWKEQRLNHAYNFIETIKNDPNFLDSIITGNESWCFAYDPETRRQSSKWCSLNTSPSKKFWFQNSRIKMMLILFFDSKGVIPPNMYLKVKHWMQYFTFKFWTICVSVLPVWGQKCCDSDQKSIFDHNRLINLQKSIFQSNHRLLIIYDRSFYFRMINFSIFLAAFHLTCMDKSEDLNCAIQTLRFIRMCVGLYGP